MQHKQIQPLYLDIRDRAAQRQIEEVARPTVRRPRRPAPLAFLAALLAL